VAAAGAEGGGGGGERADGGDVQLRHDGRHQCRRQPLQARLAGAGGFFLRFHHTHAHALSSDPLLFLNVHC